MSDKPINELAILFDADNTLIDNDRVKADIQSALLRVLGERGAARFWELYEQVRHESAVVDYPETLRRFAAEWADKRAADEAAHIVNHLPYTDYLYPGSLPALEYASRLGLAAVVSDGDRVYQPRKIAAAGITEAVGGPQNVLIYTHKDQSLDDMMRRLPAQHYVMVDDKERILANMKVALGERVTTVWVKQGHYAHDPAQYKQPDPDIVLDTIGDLCKLDAFYLK